MEALLNYFASWTPMHYLELGIMVALAVLVCVLSTRNMTTNYIAVYIPVFVVCTLATIVTDAFFAVSIWHFHFLAQCLFGGLSLFMYSSEIKRAFRTKKSKLSSEPTGEKGMTAEECIRHIIKALQNMSKSDTGALIVLANGVLPPPARDSGVILNAQISSQLIEGIFFPKSPLHDGAMILEGKKIKSAATFLPLSTNENFPKEMGTRHRAGIGITEQANVTALIVSEETGIISIVHPGGIVDRYVDYNGLRKVLEEYYWKDLTVEQSGKSGHKNEYHRIG